MSRYSTLDAALIAAVAAGTTQFRTIVSRVRGHVEPLASAGWGRPNGDRIVDRRLQALRKAGRLVFADRQWRVPAPIDPSLQRLTIASRHLPDYLLINRLDGTAWTAGPSARDAATLTWEAQTPNPLLVLEAFAEGRIRHLDRGACPDGIEGPDRRDPQCPICQALQACRPPAPQDAHVAQGHGGTRPSMPAPLQERI